ncbi:hypothetical protein WAE56_16535 [Iodobacter sp. LRB]|uniref:hypothetical protein n=1 Tax=unclassified Iodobacter TaxID=235634 RepID=UPI000C0E62D2|nr:hypothetical protein [Iodobacter sp. BJB302]PHV00446.1 hypothetical protein CSQ88_17095 [Iodobacter sp. BJB302]
MSKTIIESGMSFGPYSVDDCFELEKSAIYQRIQKQVMMAEFALIRQKEGQPRVIWLVEAKSSSPRPETQPGFDAFIDEIRQKLSNALHLVLSAKLNRHRESVTDLPNGFKSLTLQEDFKLVLVINNHRSEWLPPLQDALNSVLRTLVSTLGLRPNSVAVINDVMARSYGLIS